MIELPAYADDPEERDRLHQWLLRQDVEEVLRLVRKDRISIEQLPPQLKQPASEDFRRSLDQQTADRALSQLPEGLGIALLLAYEDPEKVVAQLGEPPRREQLLPVRETGVSAATGEEVEVERLEMIEADSPWVWGVADGYIFVEGASSEQLEQAVMAARDAS